MSKTNLINQIHFCCRYSIQLVTQLGTINSPDEELIPPQSLQKDVSYNILLHNLPDFIRAKGNGTTKGLTKEEFDDRYGKELHYDIDTPEPEKVAIIQTIVNLFFEIEEVYEMSGLLSLNANITRNERAIKASANYRNDNGEFMDNLLNESDDDDDYESTDDDDYVSIIDSGTDGVKSSVFVGDREVELGDLRVLCSLSSKYHLFGDGGNISDQTECRLLSNVTNASFSSFINTFIYTGSIHSSIINDFTTMIVLYAQEFAVEIDDGSLKSKSNFKGQNHSRKDLKSSVSRSLVEETNNGVAYWQTYAWFNLNNATVEDYRNWCESCFMYLVLYLDLIESIPDDMKLPPNRLPNQNIVFRTKVEGLNVNDIRMAAASCELNKLFAKKGGLRSQVRSIVSYLMILTANSYTVNHVDNSRITTWTLFPLSKYSQSQFLTNINYQQLYAILKVLILFVV